MTQNNLIKTLYVVLKHELLLAYRALAESLQPLWFFLIIICLFPLAISSNQHWLNQLAPGIVWIAALLAMLLSIDKLFWADAIDGSLEQMLLSPHPLSLLVFIKCLAHWLVTALPLIIITPLAALFFHISWHTFTVLILSLLLGTPTLILLGAVGSALTIGMRNRGVLLTILVLPLLIPILIFGAGSVTLASQNINVNGQLAFLASFFIVSLLLAPWAIAAALRISQE